ncbi:MAG: dicarboxylate/amino acid:cation symporter [Candidatus Woesearchaeota archaeon]
MKSKIGENLNNLTEKVFHKKDHSNNILLKRADSIFHLIETKLWLKVIVALFLGVLFGVLIGPDLNLVSSEFSQILTEWIALPGHLFLEMIKMIMIPLIFSSIILGIVSSGDINFLKRIGPKLAVYFVTTTTIAIIIGILVTSLIVPGNYIDTEMLTVSNPDLDTSVIDQDQSVPEMLISIIPSNPFEAIASGDMLGIVIFTILIGVSLLFVTGEYFKTAVNLLETIQLVSMRVVKWAMYLVPIAVFGLIMQVTSSIGISALSGLSAYIISVIIGLFILILFYLIIITLFTNQSPLHFLSNIKEPQLLAFSTSSSAAVMPLSMKTAEEKLKIRSSISQFIIPVGATINMDGTALYQAVATIFLAQAYGVELSLASLVAIIAITVGASIGSPSVPGVGIVILATILSSVGIPAAGIGLILGVDRILDMFRTTINVTGDLTACSFFDKQLSDSF